MDYSRLDLATENEVRIAREVHSELLLTLSLQAFSRPSGLKPPSQVPKISSSQSRPLGELQDSSMNSRSAMPPPVNGKHKPSGCKIPVPAIGEPNRPLTPAVPEPAFKRKTLVEKAGEFDRKIAPPNSRPVASGVKGITARGFAASTSRVSANKASHHSSVGSFGGSMGPGARVPGNNARPRSAYGHHARSKSHHQGMRPTTGMKQREEESDDDRAERKGVQTFPSIPIPKESSFKVSKHRSSASDKTLNSLSVPSIRASVFSHSRSTSSPSNVRSITPVDEEPVKSDCEDICTNLETLRLDYSKAVHGISRKAMAVSSKESDHFLKPKLSHSQLPRASPVRQIATPTTQRIPPLTPGRTKQPFLSRFTNERCPDFYDDRMETMEREFRMFKEKMETDLRTTTDYKDTIQQLQTRGKPTH